MERAGQLLDRVVALHRSGAGREELLRAIQQLQAEVAGHGMAMPQPIVERSGKVSVIMPFQAPVIEAGEPGIVASIKQPVEEEKIIQVLQVDEKELEAELEELKKAAELKNELSIKVRQARVEWEDPMDDIPTMASHRDYLPKPDASPSTTRKEHLPDPQASMPEANRDLNEVIGRSDASLNERLRNLQAELSEKLQEAPLKDLRKAIGINDRYLYINELFNGNEAMFDRSLKTLNAFSVYAEAEFWMQRELRIKLGWKDSNLLVQQFIQLVKRRFS
jgi:hypothetical protein